MSKSHPRWRLAKKILTWLFFIAVIVLLVAMQMAVGLFIRPNEIYTVQ